MKNCEILGKNSPAKTETAPHEGAVTNSEQDFIERGSREIKIQSFENHF